MSLVSIELHLLYSNDMFVFYKLFVFPIAVSVVSSIDYYVYMAVVNDYNDYI